MFRRLALLLLPVTLFWLANAHANANLHSSTPDARAQERPVASPESQASLESHAEVWRLVVGAPSLDSSRVALVGPPMPAAAVAVPELHAASVAMRDAARTAVPVSASSMHARRARHMASRRASRTVHRLDALWRADAQRTLAIPQYATAPPLIG